MLKFFFYFLRTYVIFKFFTKKCYYEEIYINYSEIDSKEFKKILKQAFLQP